MGVIYLELPKLLELTKEILMLNLVGQSLTYKLLFDQLECITGIDTGDDGPLQSRYNLHSMELRHKIEVIISLDRDNPSVESIEQIWRIGDWFERETYDMFGIVYEGHRDLRRILCPDDWEGWPLRKDYELQETYHGIMVPKVKEEEGWE